MPTITDLHTTLSDLINWPATIPTDVLLSYAARGTIVIGLCAMAVYIIVRFITEPLHDEEPDQEQDA